MAREREREWSNGRREVMLLGMAAAASVEKRRACAFRERSQDNNTVYHLYLRRREVEGGLARRNVDVCERGKV
jgi:hypothetical protein